MLLYVQYTQVTDTKISMLLTTQCEYVSYIFYIIIMDIYCSQPKVAIGA